LLHRSDSGVVFVCCNAASAPAEPSCRPIRRKRRKIGDNPRFETLFGFDSLHKSGSIPASFSEANQDNNPFNELWGFPQ
jgi:hypothetical protein